MPSSNKRKTPDHPGGASSSSPQTSDENASATQKNADGSKRKGAKPRSRKRRMTATETPGNPDDPKSFIEIKRHEQKLAAYLGLNSTTDLRCFALSWPVIKAFMEFNEISSNLAKFEALELLRDDEDEYRRQLLPHLKWPLKNLGKYGNKAKDTAKTTDAERTEYDNRGSRIAWILLRMESDIQTYSTKGERANASETECFLSALRSYLGKELPSKCPGSPIPQMSREGESRLESINRCWLILKYIQEVKRTTNFWDNRFVSIDKVHAGRTIDEGQIPQWMRPKVQDAHQSSKPTAPLANAQRPITVMVNWNRESKFPDSDDLDYILRTRKLEKIRVPQARQVLTHDPRTLKDVSLFRDTIRRMYNTAALGLQIRSLELSWKHQGVSKTVDTFTTYYEGLCQIFNDEANSDFELELFLEVNEDPEHDRYETTTFDIPDPVPRDTDTDLIDDDLPFFQASTGQGQPTPRFMDNRERQLEFYENFDVTTEEGRREWQIRWIYHMLNDYGRAEIKREVPPLRLSGAQVAAIREAQNRSHHEYDSQRQHSDSYYISQRALSGTDQRAGPEVDVCLELLLCEGVDGSRYRSKLLDRHIDTPLFYYQVSGAVGVILKQYGRIDARRLLDYAGVDPDSDDGKQVVHAARALEDICIHSALLADDTGVGKTMTLMLIAVIHASQTRINRPMLLVVPSSLILQWLEEAKAHWPGLRLVLSHSDEGLVKSSKGGTLGNQEMKERKANGALSDLFDDNISNRNVIVITSYETHKARTAEKVEKVVHPGDPHDPPQFNVDGSPIWKTPPVMKKVWETKHNGMFSLLIADEAHKAKNRRTALWQILMTQEFPKIVLATATPMFNRVDDLLGLVGLLGFPGRDASESSNVGVSDNSGEDQLDPENYKEMCQRLRKFDRCDPKRRILLDTSILQKLLRNSADPHATVAEYFCLLMDMVAIQRSSASKLPTSDRKGIAMRDLFKQVLYKTAFMTLAPHEVQEYQHRHQKAALEYQEASRKATRASASRPGQPFYMSTSPVRRLGIACMSTKGARLDAKMMEEDKDTLIAQVNRWREQGCCLDYIRSLVKTESDPIQYPAPTAAKLLDFMVDGSPVLRLIFEQILDVKVLEPLDKKTLGHHQKLLIGENHPINALLIEMVLRDALIDARVLYSKMTHTERSKLVQEFNDPKSTFKVMIMTYDVGGVGLNLHHACNRVVLASLGRSRAQEAQLAGRCLRVTSEFPLTVIRRYTRNSHDAFRSALQTEKAALQLAVNAYNVDIRNAIVYLLEELQPEVNRCWLSDDTVGIIQRLKAALTRKGLKSHAGELEGLIAEMNRYRERAMGAGPSGMLSTSDNIEPGQPDHSAPKASGMRSRVGNVDRSERDDSVPGTISRLRGGRSGATGLYVSQDEMDSDEINKIVDSQADQDFVPESESEPESESLDADADWSDDGVLADDEGDIGGTSDANTDDEFWRRLARRQRLLKTKGRPAREKALLEGVKQVQLNDRERHLIALANMKPGRVWKLDDLGDEKALRTGLILLYNKMTGMNELHFNRSIHIDYSEIPPLDDV